AQERLKGCGAVLTGEGRLDRTSFFGKAPVELARLPRAARVPSAFVCGEAEPAAARKNGFTLSLAEAGAKGDDPLRRAAFWAKKASALAIRRLLLAALCLIFVGAARAASTEELAAIDKLYFHRNQGTNLDA